MDKSIVRIISRDGIAMPMEGAMCAVRSLSWDKYGSKQADIDCGTLPPDLIIGLLGCQIIIERLGGRIIWRGWIHECSAPIGNGLSVSRSLEGVFNRIMVRWTETAGQIKRAKKSLWAVDAVSVSQYGKRDKILSLSDRTESAALAERDSLLAASAKPSIRVGNGSVGLTALGWYAQASAIKPMRIGMDISNDASANDQENRVFVFESASQTPINIGMQSVLCAPGNSAVCVINGIRVRLRGETAAQRGIKCQIIVDGVIRGETAETKLASANFQWLNMQGFPRIIVPENAAILINPYPIDAPDLTYMAHQSDGAVPDIRLEVKAI